MKIKTSIENVKQTPVVVVESGLFCRTVDCSPPGSPVHAIFRQESWSGLPFPSPAAQGSNTSPGSHALAGGFFTTEPPGKPQHIRTVQI